MNFKKILLAIGAVSALAMAPVAHAIPFSISAVGFTPGAGYGVDANEAAPTLLDVKFTTAGTFVPQNFVLDQVGDFITFNFGTIQLSEPDAHGGIAASETDGLGVSASFTFLNPLGITQNILATGTAYTGSVSDANRDYQIVWNPILVPFGVAAEFKIEMNSLAFFNRSTQIQTATITLTKIPEPATLALLGLGLLGFALARRKSFGGNAA